MSNIIELFGISTNQKNIDWEKIIDEQRCIFSNKRCYKIRKSSPDIAIGTCTVLYGKSSQPIIICPTRLLEHGKIFTDCFHLLTNHEPGNEIHTIPEVSIPGGSVDYFLVSVKNGKVKDFVGIELQTLDTTGTVWPERQRLLKELAISRQDDAEHSLKPYGMNWKMTAKTILIQMHHKVQTFEHINKKIALVVQDRFLSYMAKEFQFSHLKNPASIGDSIHFHAYGMGQTPLGAFNLSMVSRMSTDADGIGTCLGLQAEARVDLERIIESLQTKISPETLFRPV